MRKLLCSEDFASANVLRFRYFAAIQHAKADNKICTTAIHKEDENDDLRKACFACGGLHFSIANFQEVEPVLKNVYAFAMYACSVGHEMVKSGRGLTRRSIQFCAACFPWRSPNDDNFRDISGVVMQRFLQTPGCLNFRACRGARDQCKSGTNKDASFDL